MQYVTVDFKRVYVCMYVWEWIKSCLLLRNHHVSILLMSFIDLLLVVVTYLSDVKVKLSLYAMAACRLKVRMLLLCGWLEAVSDDQIWNVIVWGDADQISFLIQTPMNKWLMSNQMSWSKTGRIGQSHIVWLIKLWEHYWSYWSHFHPCLTLDPI